MPKKAERSLEKVTLNLYEGDKETLAAFYPKLGWSVATRWLIHQFCNRLREENDNLEYNPVEIVIPPLENSE